MLIVETLLVGVLAVGLGSAHSAPEHAEDRFDAERLADLERKWGTEVRF
jgi:hypothetical protein